MLAPIIEEDRLVDLVENSGIQFLDRQFTLNLFTPSDKKRFGNGFSLQKNAQEPLIPVLTDEEGRLYEASHPEVNIDPQDPRLISVESRDSLTIYNGVWFPVPFLADNLLDKDGTLNCDSSLAGPFNWARCRVVRKDTEDGVRGTLYRVVFAFDTAVRNDHNSEYAAPTADNVKSGTRYAMTLAGGTELLRTRQSGFAWGNEWAERVYSDATKLNRSLKISKEFLKENLAQRVHEAHYLNMLSLISQLCTPPAVRLIQRGSANVGGSIGVTLVLDIGNSRSCGILMEDSGGSTFKTARLSLRDLNAPENVYEEAFESRIEFAKANFDYDGRSARSGRSDAFIWPSLVRTGVEAANLAARRSGNEGLTGIISPKRYLWNERSSGKSGEWCFNPYSYQIPLIDRLSGKNQGYGQPEECGPKREAFLSPVSDCINSKGDALFACEDPGNFHAMYSGKSTMTFMLQEIFLQALVQINSCAYRFRTAFKDTPRTLRAVVLTTPPSMPDLEREIYRGCAYEALGILWKCLGYDASPVNEFHFTSETIDPKVPEVVLDWDEAQAAQIVYLYNETQEIFGGNCGRYLNFIRREDADGRFGERKLDENGQEYFVARIASLDIGGGTTDMVITDYAFPKDTPEEAATVKAREVLREGYKLAGDDLLRELIEKTVLSQLAMAVDANMQEHGRGFSDQALSSIFGENSAQDSGEQFRTARQQATQQIFMKIGYRILAHLERLKELSVDKTEIKIFGTIKDFLLGQEHCSCEEGALINPSSYPLPASEVVKFVNDCFKQYLSNFDILEFKLDLNLTALSAEVTAGSTRLAPALSTLSALFNLYRPDLLLLTGRVANISGVREYFLSRCQLPSDRLISLSSYRCGSWYPFAGHGSAIGDTKTTVAMGAALAYMRRSSQAVRNFRFDLSMPAAASTVRYLGHMDSFAHVTAPFYRFVTSNELALASGTDFIDYSDDGDRMEEIMRKQDDASLDNLSSFEDVHVLPDDLGYRQFPSPEHPASMLYSIEREEDFEELESLKKASAYAFFDGNSIGDLIKDQSLLGDEERKLCEQAEAEFKRDCATVDSAPELEAYASSCKARAHEQALAQAQSELASSAPKGMLAALHRRRFEESIIKRTNELEQTSLLEVEQLIATKREELIEKYAENFKLIIRKVLAEHYRDVREQCRQKFATVERLVNTNARFSLQLSLDSDKGTIAPYPRLKNLWAEIACDHRIKLPAVFRLKLDQVSCEGRNFSGFVKLKLKTVNRGDENYWTDTGRIYSGMQLLSSVLGK